MWASRFFASRFFISRYWNAAGGVVSIVIEAIRRMGPPGRVQRGGPGFGGRVG